jgi:hypothetical protein
MKRYRFSHTERLAIFTMHGSCCYLCSTPIDLQSMTVDHIIPASLPSNPTLFAACLADYGLPPTFDVDSFENWLPACAKCNGQKGSQPFRPTPIVQRYLQRAIDRAPDVRRMIATSISTQKQRNAIGSIMAAIEAGSIDESTIAALIQFYEEYRPKGAGADLTQGELRLTPDLTVLYETKSYQIVSIGGGVGYVPTMPAPDISFYCGNCGSPGPWNGSICRMCNMVVGDD